tara:strand:- start:1089 stop:1985 length:897 start_codon:yes stop_codon:yes gene_type:complete
MFDSSIIPSRNIATQTAVSGEKSSSGRGRFPRKFPLRSISGAFALISASCISVGGALASTILYQQNFEAPVNFIDTSGVDVSQQSVNSLYGNQPPGFTFAQQHTVETLEINGGVAFGTGYIDTAGRAGNYMGGMLSSGQDDRLGLAFNVGSFDFLNMSIDVTSIDLNGLAGPFVPGFGVTTNPGTEPTFRFTLFDNPSGANGIGSGTALDFADVTGTVSDRNVVDFVTAVIGLDASGSTNGNVILQFDLLTGGYAGFDNITIVASNTQGEVNIPAPGVLPLFALGLAGLAFARRKHRR